MQTKASIRNHRMVYPLIVVAVLVLGACAPSHDPNAVAAASAAIPAGVSDPSGSCTLVSSAEMSAILGRDVKAVQRPADGGMSDCSYYAADSHEYLFSLTLERDSLDTARNSVDAPLHHGPATAAAPYADIGDQVGQAFKGRMLVVVIGKDLLNFNLAEMPDVSHVTIKRIVETAAPRLRQ